MCFSKCCCLICALVNCNGSGVIFVCVTGVDQSIFKISSSVNVISSFCLLYHSLVIGYLYKYVAKSERPKGENKLKIILYNKTTSIVGGL
jgi:hypothetical protein